MRGGSWGSKCNASRALVHLTLPLPGAVPAAFQGLSSSSGSGSTSGSGSGSSAGAAGASKASGGGGGGSKCGRPLIDTASEAGGLGPGRPGTGGSGGGSGLHLQAAEEGLVQIGGGQGHRGPSPAPPISLEDPAGQVLAPAGAAAVYSTSCPPPPPPPPSVATSISASAAAPWAGGWLSSDGRPSGDGAQQGQQGTFPPHLQVWAPPTYSPRYLAGPAQGDSRQLCLVAESCKTRLD